MTTCHFEMTDAAILATFADWRTVKGRKVLQLIFEVPLENQAKVLTHLGAPMPMSEMWCGIARVEKKSLGEATTREDVGCVRSATLAPTAHHSSPAKPKQRWSDLRPSARAALLTKDPQFWEWACMAEPRDYPKTGLNEANTDTWLKNRLGITSKSELDVAGAQSSMRFYFDELAENFRAWQQAKGHHQI